MEKEEIEKQVSEILQKENLFIGKGIENVNHKPHPFTIGPKHVAHAADHCGGMLGDETIKAIPCAAPGCRLSYEHHTSDKVLFLSLVGNTTKELAQIELKKLVELMEANKIDGICMVETPEKFRIE